MKEKAENLLRESFTQQYPLRHLGKTFSVLLQKPEKPIRKGNKTTNAHNKLTMCLGKSFCLSHSILWDGKND